MRLTDLAAPYYDGALNPDVRGVTQDSRQVKAGWLFAALSGNKVHGHHYIEQAIGNGAVAVLAAPGTDVPKGVALIAHDNPRAVLSHLAARFYGQQPETVVAVTGTNGKTSTVTFTQQIWEALHYKAASLGTLGVRGAIPARYGAMTTPDPVTLHAELADLAAAGITHLAMEASSHGLHQYRLEGVKVKAAGFTNLTRDHLDYHPTMDDYLAAKARLFSDVLAADGTAVLNADSEAFAVLEKLCRDRGVRVCAYGRKGADIRLIDRAPLPQGQALTIELDGRRYEFVLPLVGEFMAMNVLCALGLVLAQDGARADEVIEALTHLQGAPGRVQLVPGHPRDAAIYVDYAHTPDALQNVLEALRPHTQNRLIVIAGCGGDRDPGKRPLMGHIAVTCADVAIITDDNPRTEDPAKIRAAMMAAAPGAIEVDGRRAAIEKAVALLQDGDVLVIAGKGHEQGQIIGDKVEPFDDVEEAARAIGNERIKKEKGV